MLSPRPLMITALSLGLLWPFLGHPIHIDEANFIRLAQGAVNHPFRPHLIPINWQGTTQPAFEVLSNPPGIAYLLAPVLEWPLAFQRLWIALWLIPTLYGAQALGAGRNEEGRAIPWMLASSPIVLWSAQSLTPDLPLLATVTLSMGGIAAGRPATFPLWAAIGGLSVWFRYSGLCLIPLIAISGWFRHRRWDGALFASLPLMALALHDHFAYGQIHLLSMVGFQREVAAPGAGVRHGLALVCMLGGAAALPIWSNNSWRTWGWAGLGGLVAGGLAAACSPLTPLQSAWTALFFSFGAIALAPAIEALVGLIRGTLPWRLGWPALWVWVGLCFLLTLRFAATRYLLPFLPALMCLYPSPPALRRSVVMGFGLSLLLLIDDTRFAHAQQEGAAWVMAHWPDGGTFAGHWGWQHTLEASGKWTALEEDTVPRLPLAVSATAWPQSPASTTCLAPLGTREAPGPGGFWPRVHSTLFAAHLHASAISRDPPLDSYAPWGFGAEPYDRVTVYGPCPGSGG